MSTFNTFGNIKDNLINIYWNITVIVLSLIGVVFTVTTIVDIKGKYLIPYDHRVYLMILFNCILGFTIAILVLNIQKYYRILACEVASGKY